MLLKPCLPGPAKCSARESDGFGGQGGVVQPRGPDEQSLPTSSNARACKQMDEDGMLVSGATCLCGLD